MFSVAVIRMFDCKSFFSKQNEFIKMVTFERGKKMEILHHIRNLLADKHKYRI